MTMKRLALAIVVSMLALSGCRASMSVGERTPASHGQYETLG